MDLYTIRNKLNMGISLTELPLKVVTYSRVSTEHLEQKTSLRNQVEHFYEYIINNKNWTYINSYVDEGITGTSDIKRDNFMKMIEDAALGNFDLIITKEISRFSRNTLDSIKYTRLLLSYGVYVLFVNDNINTALPDSELRLTIMASMAQDEVRRLSERVKFGMNRAILKGEILGNDMLYGYKKDKITKNLTIIEREAKVVRKIYELYVIDKLSLSKIAKYLNEKNITTRNEKKWTITTISRMIKNPKYKGYYCGKKSEIIDYMTKKVKYLDSSNWIMYKDNQKIPKIIEESLWNKANNRLSNREKKSPKITNRNYLYSGKIYCYNHNTIFNRRIFRRNKKDVTWICSMYLKNGSNYCPSPNIRESELTTILKYLISKLNIELSNIITILITNYKKYNSITTNLNIEQKNIITQKKLIFQKKDKLLELNINGNISDNELTLRNNLLNNQLKRIESNLNNLNKQNNINLYNLETYLKQYINSQQITEKVISLILKKIVASKKDNIINLKIYLTDLAKYYKNSLPNTSYHTFKRGLDTKCTKRYDVIYKVEYAL